MIEFTLGMPAEEYIRKHKKLLLIAADRMKMVNSNARQLDCRRLESFPLYMYYIQVPTTNPVTLHAFVFSVKKSYRVPRVEDSFDEDPVGTAAHNKMRYQMCLAVGFDTPVGKYIYFSTQPWLNAEQKFSTETIQWNILLSPHYLEEYQKHTRRGSYRNVLHKFIAEEYMGLGGVNLKGIPCYYPGSDYSSIKGCLKSESGLSLGCLIGDIDKHEDEPFSKGILQLNSFIPNSRLTDSILQFANLKD